MPPQRHQTGLQLGFADISHGGDLQQDGVRRLAPQDGRRLQDAAVIGVEPVEAGHQQPLNRARYFGLTQSSFDAPALLRGYQRPGLLERGDRLLQEERVSLRLLQDGGARSPGQHFLVQQIVQQHLALLVRQTSQRQEAVVRLALPAEGVFRTIDGYQQDWRTVQIAQALPDDLHAGLVDPVGVLHNDDEGALAGPVCQQPLEVVDQVAPPDLRFGGGGLIRGRFQAQHLAEAGAELVPISLRQAHARQRVPQLAVGGLGHVGRVDPEEIARDLGQPGEGRSLLMGLADAQEPGGLGVIDELGELVEEAGFAHPGLAHQADHLSVPRAAAIPASA